MEQEHDGAGDALAEIRELTSGYNPSACACSTVRATRKSRLSAESDTKWVLPIPSKLKSCCRKLWPLM